MRFRKQRNLRRGIRDRQPISHYSTTKQINPIMRGSVDNRADPNREKKFRYNENCAKDIIPRKTNFTLDVWYVLKRKKKYVACTMY